MTNWDHDILDAEDPAKPIEVGPVSIWIFWRSVLLITIMVILINGLFTFTGMEKPFVYGKFELTYSVIALQLVWILAAYFFIRSRQLHQLASWRIFLWGFSYTIVSFLMLSIFFLFLDGNDRPFVIQLLRLFTLSLAYISGGLTLVALAYWRRRWYGLAIGGMALSILIFGYLRWSRMILVDWLSL